MRKLTLTLVLAALGLLMAPLASPAATANHGPGSFPEKIALPAGFAPEGLAIGHGKQFFVGSVQTGAIYTGDLRTGTGRILVPGATTAGTNAATGVAYDRGLLWVAGAGFGTAKLYDAKTGALLQTYQLGTPPATFINGIAVTRKAAYFSDSQQPVIYRVSRSKHGAPGQVTTIPLTGDYQHVGGGALNLNGIVATADGKKLIAVQTAAKKLFVIDPRSGATTAIDTGTYDLANGDGLLLEGRTLFVVQNRSNTIAVFRLSHDLATATFVKAITDPDFDVPTSIDHAGKHLYVVNARFGTATPADPHYDVVKVG